MKEFNNLLQIYIGYNKDFEYNPLIKNQQNKQKIITSIIEPFNNPYIIFIYTHTYKDFSKIIHLFMNPFILISHNSDENDEVLKILNYSNLIKWYTVYTKFMF